MKKVLALAMLVCIAGTTAGNTLDFVVLLDVSSSMLPYFDETVNFLIRDILSEHLREGDRFHLLSFADVPEIELTRTITNSQEIDEILFRILLLQPLGRYTDLVSALRFLFNYSSQTSVSSSKKILVLTDGIHDPPPGSRFALEGASAIDDAISEVARNIRREGWSMSIVQFPDDTPVNVTHIGESTSSDGEKASDGGENSEDEEHVGDRDGAATIDGADDQSKPETISSARNLLSELSDDLGVDVVTYDGASEELSHRASGAPQVGFPPDLGRIRRSFTIPFLVAHVGSGSERLKLTGIIWNSVDILRKPVDLTLAPDSQSTLRAMVRLPDSLPAGTYDLELQLDFSDELRAYPRTGSVKVVLVGSGIDSERLFRVLGFIGLGLISLGLLIAFALFLRAVISRTVSAAASSATVRYREIPPGEPAVEMIVEGQNRNIGTRNVNVVPDGGRRSVGAGRSAFLIFAFPIKHRLAELARDGNRYSFVPIATEYCDSDGTIDDCLDQPITLKSTTGREVTVVFRQYVSPLERINRIMHLIDTAGRSRSGSVSRR